jgi:hypothetical protein
VAALARAPAAAGLTRLDLGQNGLGPADAEALSAARRLAGLSTLRLSGNELRGGAVRLVASPRLAGLRALLLDYNGVDAPAAEGLAALPGLVRLRYLNLGGNPLLGARGAAPLAASPHAANLRTLHLWGAKLGDAGAAALADSPHLGELTELNLQSADVGAAGALALARSKHLRHLRVLSLQGNKVSRLKNKVGGQATRALRARFGEAVEL